MGLQEMQMVNMKEKERGEEVSLEKSEPQTLPRSDEGAQTYTRVGNERRGYI